MNRLTSETYKQLFEEHYATLVQFASGFCKSVAVAEDLVQQVYVNVWEKRAVLEVQVSWRSYLYTATRNQALNWMRRADRQQDLTVAENAEGGPTPTMRVEQGELGQQLAEAMELLPPKCREVFRLKRQEGYSYREIAGEMRISEKTVENQLGIALKKLREVLKDYWEEHYGG